MACLGPAPRTYRKENDWLSWRTASFWFEGIFNQHWFRNVSAFLRIHNRGNTNFRDTSSCSHGNHYRMKSEAAAGRGGGALGANLAPLQPAVSPSGWKPNAGGVIKHRSVPRFTPSELPLWEHRSKCTLNSRKAQKSNLQTKWIGQPRRSSGFILYSVVGTVVRVNC